MLGRNRYTEEFKREAVAQVTDRGHSVASVADRIGVSTKSLYDWVKRYGDGSRKVSAEAAEVRRLKAELRRVTEERDILKKGNGVLRKGPPVKYAFIKAHKSLFFYPGDVPSSKRPSQRFLRLAQVWSWPHGQAAATLKPG